MSASVYPCVLPGRRLTGAIFTIAIVTRKRLSADTHTRRRALVQGHSRGEDTHKGGHHRRTVVLLIGLTWELRLDTVPMKEWQEDAARHGANSARRAVRVFERRGRYSCKTFVRAHPSDPHAGGLSIARWDSLQLCLYDSSRDGLVPFPSPTFRQPCAGRPCTPN